MVDTSVTGEAEANTPTILQLVGKIWYHTHGLKNGREASEPLLLEYISELLIVLGVTAADEVQRLLDLIRSRLVLQLASMYFKPKLEPKLQEHKLEWADVLPVLNTIDFSVKGLKAALDDPMALFEKMAKASEPLDAVGKKLASMHLKPKLEPKLQKHELECTEVLPVPESRSCRRRSQHAFASKPGRSRIPSTFFPTR
jgi:hypothetical protein